MRSKTTLDHLPIIHLKTWLYAILLTSSLWMTTEWACFGFVQRYNYVGITAKKTSMTTRTTLSLSIQPNNNNTTGQQTEEECIANKNKIKGVTLKMAFDGSDLWGIADASETSSERFTSEKSLDLVHRLRRDSDCVLVGRGTVERDDCSLTVRRVSCQKQPVRVVIDPNLALLRQRLQKCYFVKKEEEEPFVLFRDGLPTILYYLDNVSLSSLEIKDSISKNVIFVAIPSKDDDNISKLSKSTTLIGSTIHPRDILDDLHSRNITHVMVEGGPITAKAFLRHQLVDRAIIIRSPRIFTEPIPSFINETTLEEAKLRLIGEMDSDGDCVQCWSRPDLPWPSENVSDWP